jgi:simple sugar transport system ATP-binding protein
MQKSERELQRLEKDYHLEVDINAVINTLPVGLQQRVEILKALYRGADILILDEPTGVLTPQEADHLFRILKELREQGKTVILITHKLREIMAITDNVSVMRQGEMVAHRKTSETNREELAELMVGRKVLMQVDKAPTKPGSPMLTVKHLDYTDDFGVRRVKDVSFEVNCSEIVGIAGVSGNGQSELMDVITGIKPLQKGQIQISDQTITSTVRGNAAAMRRFGMAHVPEDRQRRGLVTSFSANENIILGYHKDPAYNKFIEMDRNAIIQSCKKQMEHFDVRPNNPHLRASLFSGGNQQKLVVTREFERNPTLLVVGQPTRGVDIGAIEFIHRQIIAVRDAGKAVLLVSVELDEILSLSDRILVMFDGQVMGEILAKDADEREIGLLMAGVRKEAA